MDYNSAPHHGGENPNKHKHSPKSSSELLSSAKFVAAAAKSTFGGSKSEQEVDKAKAAEAAADLICAASHYGKLEDKALGKYVEQAEDYLHKYNASHGSGGGHGHAAAPAAHKPSHDAGGGGSEGGYGHSGSPAAHKPSHDAGGGGSEGGYGHSGAPAADKPAHDAGGGGSEGGSGGYGDYFKMAQDFLKK